MIKQLINYVICWFIFLIIIVAVLQLNILSAVCLKYNDLFKASFFFMLRAFHV